MFRNENYFLDELKKDTVLYDIFSCIGEYSTIYHEDYSYFEPKQVKLEDVMVIIKSHVINKSDSVIQTYIDKLINYGLCKYVIENDNNTFMSDNSKDIDDDNRLKYYNDLGYPKEDTQIKLTSHILLGCSGISLYENIVMDKKSIGNKKLFAEQFQSIVDEIAKPYDDKIKNLTRKLDDKMIEVNHTIDSGVIKNIQVISVFAGIISLLFANIMGIKDFQSLEFQDY